MQNYVAASTYGNPDTPASAGGEHKQFEEVAF